MKSLVYIVAFVLCTSVDTSTMAIAAETDIDSIRKMESELARSLVERDSRWFQAALADDWTITLSGGGVSNKQAFLAALQAGKLGYTRFDVSDLKVRLYGDTAIAIGHLNVSRAPKKWPEGQERRTDVYVRINGVRKCVTTHVTAVDSMMMDPSWSW